jgi:anionic cell wall polymer biosynthesis LytR-Cps2A-Psr (LCP) family protein
MSVVDQKMGNKRKIKLWRFLLIIVLGGVFSLGLIFLYLNFSFLPGRTNFLLLGMTGNNQAGSDLTDTIIFASIENQTGEVLLLSLPRDIWIKPIRAKLNTTYHYGGLDLAKETVVSVLGRPVDYAVLIEADLFVELIDFLGGVEVQVKRGFDDYRYPIPGRENDACGGDPEYACRYEHLHFEAGKQLMDGRRALKYARSRYAEGEEGNDLARNERQQGLILAIRDRLLSPQFLLDPKRVSQLLEIVLAGVKTDLPREKYFDLLRTAIRFRPGKLKTVVLNDDFLIHPDDSEPFYDGQWVLIPRVGDWSEIQEYLNQLLISN